MSEQHEIMISQSYVILKNPNGDDFYIGAKHLEIISKAISKSKSLKKRGLTTVERMYIEA